MKKLEDYLDKADAVAITEEQVVELLAPTQLQKVHVGRLTKEKFPDLKDEVFVIRNESPIVDELINMLGVPKDGTPIRIRTGFIKVGPKAGMLFFAKNRTDLPGERAQVAEAGTYGTAKEVLAKKAAAVKAEQDAKRPSEVQLALRKLPMTKKPTHWADIKVIDVDADLLDDLKVYKLNDIELDDETNPLSDMYKTPKETVFVLKIPPRRITSDSNGGVFLVNTEGARYIRYAAKLPKDLADLF